MAAVLERRVVRVILIVLATLAGRVVKMIVVATLA